MKSPIIILLSIVLSTCLSGCSTIKNVLRGEPDIVDNNFLVPNADTPTPPPACAGAESMTDYIAIRKCTEAMKLLIDVRWAHYADSLNAAVTSGVTAIDAVSLGLSTAGTLTPTGTTQILSAIVAGLNGLKATANQDLLYKNSITLILLQMKKDRASWATVIQKEINAGANGYKNMFEASADLYAYYRAGSWNEAIMSMQSDSGAQEAACQSELKNARLESGTPSPSTPTSQCGTKQSNVTTPANPLTISFSKGSATPDETGMTTISSAVDVFNAGVRSGKIGSIEVQGTADGASNASNLALSRQRAEAVRAKLVAAGVNQDQVKVLEPVVNGKRTAEINFR